MTTWNTLTSEDDLLRLMERSLEKPQIIFKDSVTCGISAYARERLVLGNDLMTHKADFHYLDLLRYRATSDLVAKMLDITHRSPQIIVVRDKVAIYTSSHHSINPADIALRI